MAVPGAVLVEILDRALEGRGAGGIAVVSAAGAQTDAVWRGASSRDEPGHLAYSITKTFIAVAVANFLSRRKDKAKAIKEKRDASR